MITMDIDTTGIAEFATLLDRFPVATMTSAYVAINEVAQKTALPVARRNIEAQVNFPAGYVDQPDRLWISQFATPTRLEARITGRDRATSLARFATGTISSGRAAKGVPGAVIEVKAGHAIQTKKTFLINLRNGNLGLAINVGKGNTLTGTRYNAVQLRDGVFLLYGPSVGQVFQDVAVKIEPEVASALSAEFLRQFAFRSGAV